MHGFHHHHHHGLHEADGHGHHFRFRGPDPMRHGGRGGGLGRFFAHGDLRLVILNLIAEKPRHGYEIIKAIEEAVAGTYSPSPGTIYPTLTWLEELGYVTVAPAGDGAKKQHEITEQGRAFLASNQRLLEGLLARMEEAKASKGDGPAPQVVRAMENLKLALSLRLARRPITAEEVDSIAAALDAAATAVERA